MDVLWMLCLVFYGVHYHQGAVNANKSDLELKHVVILIRHATRAPLVLDHQGILNASYYPMGVGALTALGRKQAYRLGFEFRAMYSHLLTNNPREVWARSSSVERCYQTLALLLATMYAPRGPFSWNETLDWQPIQIQNVPEGHDFYIEDCGAKGLSDFLYMFDEVGPPGFGNVGEFIRYVTNATGYDANTSKFYPTMIDGVFAQYSNQLPIPKWASDHWPAMDWAMRRLSYDYYTDFIPYYGEKLTRGIADRINEIVSENDKITKISLFGYHDTNIQAIFSALGIDYVKFYPYFMGSLHFQLFRDSKSGKYFVDVTYSTGFDSNNNYVKPSPLHFPGCEANTCSANTMMQLLRSSFPDGSANYTNCAIIADNVML